MSRQTAKRDALSLSSLWTRLEARGFAQENPWLRQGIGKKSKRGEATKRAQWTDAALVKLLSGKYTPRYTETLHDLVRLALVTGARLDERGRSRFYDVREHADGWWLTITAEKTEAAVRDVPVHDAAAHVLQRRLKRTESFLFDGLILRGAQTRKVVERLKGVWTLHAQSQSGRSTAHISRTPQHFYRSNGSCWSSRKHHKAHRRSRAPTL